MTLISEVCKRVATLILILVLGSFLTSPSLASQVTPISPGQDFAEPTPNSETASPNSFIDGWVTNTALSRFVKENENWIWPTCEILHFIGLSFLIGCIGLLDLRLIGSIKELPIKPINELLRWGILGFTINLVTGILFFVDDPAQYTHNVAFYWKMLFVILAGLNVSTFYVTGIARKVDALKPGEDAPFSAKIVGAASLFLWFGVLYFGRMLPYLGNSF